MTEQTPTPDRHPSGQERAGFALPRPWARLDGVPRWWLAPVLGAVVVIAVFAAMASSQVIDDDFDFGPGPVAAPQSRAVAMAARLVLREIDQHQWSPNDPVFLPTAWLDNMPQFQLGISDSAARFAREMAVLSDRGQGPAPNLDRAAGLFKYPGTVWKFDPSTSWSPTASSEKMYRNAARNLNGYNQDLAAGTVTFERSAETLAALAMALGHDLAAASAEIDRHLAENHSALFDTTADDVFFRTKGRVYGYGLILREIGWDHAQVLAGRDLGGAWREMVESLKTASALSPLVVLNGTPDGTFLPSHLTAQGFYLLRARAQLAEIAEHLAS